MPKKIKLKLEDLEVQSFTTNVLGVTVEISIKNGCIGPCALSHGSICPECNRTGPRASTCIDKVDGW